MSEPQQRLYRPGWLLRMYVRLEDFGAGDDSDAQDGSKPYQDARNARLAQAAVVEGQFAQMAANRSGAKSAMVGLAATARALRRSATASSGAAGDHGPGDEFSLPPFITVPQELHFEDKGFREADVLTAAFPYQDLPLFPWIVHEIRVEAWVGTLPADQFATPDGWRLAANPSERCVLRFNGYVDLPELDHDESTGTIHIKARSYIAVLMDNEMNPLAKQHRPAAEEEYITTYINRILESFPPTSGKGTGDAFRAVWYAGKGAAEPKISRKKLLRGFQTASSRNAAAGQSKSSDVNAQPDPATEQADPAGMGDAAPGGLPAIPGKAVAPEGKSIWDVITEACEMFGVMPMYKPTLPKGPGSSAGKEMQVDPANALLIVPSEAFLDDVSSATQIAGGARDGFKRQLTQADGTVISSDVRFMVWGHNVGKMKIARKMGKARPTGVEVHAYNPDAEGHLCQLVARFPKHVKKGKKSKGKGADNMTEKGGGKIDSIRTYQVKGVRDQQQLDSIAASLYHQQARQELSLELETDELASYMDPVASARAGELVPIHNEHPDILRLCSGTPVHVTVAKKSTDENDLTICSLSEFYDLSGDSIMDLLARQADRWGAWSTSGAPERLAEMATKIKRAYQSAQLPSVYYLRGLVLDFKSGDEIYHCKMELVNYLRSNDPTQLDETTREINDRRKRHPTRTVDKKAAAQQRRTAAIVQRATRIGVP